MIGYWLKSNHTSRQPNSWVAFDCEARRARTRSGETQTFRCAVAEWHHRVNNDLPWEEPRRAEFTAPGDLWRWVSGRTLKHQRTVVVAHNITYDLRVSDAVNQLEGLGWVAEPPMMGKGRLMWRFRRGHKRLVMVDSMNWWPTSLADIGERIGLPKLDLPDDDDSDEAWLRRCHRDVSILAEAWRRLIDWVASADLGTWKPTGAGQAMTAFRHHHLTDRILLHQDDDVRAVEREAAWCGRAEAWRHGKLTDGPYVEWDMTTAFCRIMEECDVPTVLVRGTGSERLWGRSVAVSGQAGIARVEVTTQVPVVPYRGSERISWPVGTFVTTLWDHELALITETGGTWRFLEGWIYLTAPALRSFAQWCRTILDAAPGTVDEVVRLTVKHFQRAIVGKFASRYWEWEEFGVALNPGPFLQTCQLDRGEKLRWMLDLGGTCYVQGPARDSEMSCPQLYSWIHAETRVRLWRLMTAAGLENVVYCDTDGVIVTPAGHEALTVAALPGVRPKTEYRTVEILGARKLILDGKLKAAGIPRGAVQLGPTRWEGEVWTQPSTALLRQENDRVVVRRETFRMVPDDHRRIRIRGGATVPIEVTQPA